MSLNAMKCKSYKLTYVSPTQSTQVWKWLCICGNNRFSPRLWSKVKKYILPQLNITAC